MAQVPFVDVINTMLIVAPSGEFSGVAKTRRSTRALLQPVRQRRAALSDVLVETSYPAFAGHVRGSPPTHPPARAEPEPLVFRTYPPDTAASTATSAFTAFILWQLGVESVDVA